MEEMDFRMPPQGIVFLLKDIFNVDCRFCSIDSPEQIYPAPEQLFTNAQFLSVQETVRLTQELQLNEMAVIFDRLFTAWLLFKNNEMVFLVGPFQAFSVNSVTISHALADLFPGKSRLAEFRNYQGHLPVIEDHWLKSLVHVFARAVSGQNDPVLKWVKSHKEDVHNIPEDTQYNEYAQNAYETEASYMEAVYFGNTKEAITALHKIHNRFRKSASNPDMLIPSIYGNAVNCTLARIAAYQAGVSPVILDRIFQEFMSLAVTSKKADEQFKQAFRMTANVCEQVQITRTAGMNTLGKRAVSYMLEHYQEALTLEKLADVLCVNKNHLSTVFTKETGKTFTQYLNDIRLEQAAMEIRLIDAPISEIAASVGIPDQNYFARIFRAKYHMSPSTWRKGT